MTTYQDSEAKIIVATRYNVPDGSREIDKQPYGKGTDKKIVRSGDLAIGDIEKVARTRNEAFRITVRNSLCHTLIKHAQ